MLRLRTIVALFLGTALLGLHATGVAGQLVVGNLTEEGSGAPVEGAFVVLVDARDARHGASLSRPDGSFVLRADGPGTYRLRVERIGYASLVSDPFGVAAGESSRHDLRLPTQAIALEGIEVEGASRCGASATAGAETALLWEEARKALTVATWAEASGFQYEVTTFTRALGSTLHAPDRGSVVRSTEERRHGWGQEVFRSIDADSLERSGYVQSEGGIPPTYSFFAPDARVLLSDSFLRTHCFRAVRDERRVGLGFEPVPDRDLPDVKGTLWFDPEKGALERLEFRYTGVPVYMTSPRVGGEVDFERVPGGAWIVRHWVIRMPRLAWRTGGAMGVGAEAELAGILETGGTVNRVRAATGSNRAPDPDRGTVEGRVVDGPGGPPVVGAEVVLYGTNYRAPTAVDGAFRIERVLGGTYTATFRHPRLDSLGLPPPERPVTVEPRRSVEVVLQMPSLDRLVADECRGRRDEPAGRSGWAGTDRFAHLTGWVRTVDGGPPLPAATVEIRWSVVESVSPVVQREEGVEVESDGRGRFVACHVPAGRVLRVRPGGEAASRETEVPPLLEGQVGRIELRARGGGRPVP